MSTCSRQIKRYLSPVSFQVPVRTQGKPIKSAIYCVTQATEMPSVGEHTGYQPGLAEAHESVEEGRLGVGHRYAAKRSLKKFFAWYEENSRMYNVCEKVEEVWRIKPGPWVKMMEEKKALGNALFDYILAERKKFWGRGRSGMSQFRDLRAAMWNCVRDSDLGHYTRKAENNISRFWTAITKANHQWIQENGIDEEAKAAVPFAVYELIC